VEILQKIWSKADKNLAMTAYTNLSLALTMLGKRKEVLDRLQVDVNSKDIYMKAYALHTLSLIGDRESAKAFVESAKDGNSEVRRTTMTAIGFLMDKNAINPLNKITADNIDVQMLIMDHILPIPVW
ncbi:MAG: HEAT repeat domain-containing protein, partial [Planctomycetota bacterium]|nr:HEAT repeat domain-containing protein [Planctomycetota bacterium]